MIPTLGQTQDLESLINQHVQAKGGIEAIRSMQTVRMIGRCRLYELDWTNMPVELSISREGRIRIDNYWFESFIVQYCDHSRAIWKDPNTDRFEKMPPYQEEKVREMADLEGCFLFPEKKGYTLELSGSETVDGKTCWKIQLSHARFEREVYLDAETCLIFKEIDVRLVQGVRIRSEKYYRDYRFSGACLFPYEIETRINGHSNAHYLFCDIQVNPDFFDSLFDRKHSPLPR